MIENFNLVQYIPLNIADEHSIDAVMTQIDLLVQYDEFRMPKEAYMPDYEDGAGEGGMQEDDNDMDY